MVELDNGEQLGRCGHPSNRREIFIQRPSDRDGAKGTAAAVMPITTVCTESPANEWRGTPIARIRALSLRNVALSVLNGKGKFAVTHQMI